MLLNLWLDFLLSSTLAGALVNASILEAWSEAFVVKSGYKCWKGSLWDRDKNYSNNLLIIITFKLY